MADTYQTQTAGSQWLGRAVLYALLVVFAVYYLMPLFVMVTTSLKTLDDIRAGNLIALPQEISFAAWVKAWGTACTGVECTGLKGNFLNSVSFVVPAVLISTLIGAFNGYVLTMWRFRGSDILFTMLLLGCFIPFQVILLPMAQTLGYLGIANSIAGLIFVHVVYGLAFTTLFFRNFYVTVPSDLTKAARIDGAGFFTIFWRIILPLSPAIMSSGSSRRSGMTFCLASCSLRAIGSRLPLR
jgi:glucose/mannose transport system permease protein